MVEEEIRRGPWTEPEDVQLVFYVNLFGDRRWDFIAKVSGLKRTGKSCRLRWVNYLHPGLKHGKMTPHEERLILQLQSKWGNRWSRIARKLPGRTDNEIKNYWRTHMRKKAQEIRKTAMSPPSSISNFSSSPVSNSPPQVDSIRITETGSLADPSSSGSKKSSSPAPNNPLPVESIAVVENEGRNFHHAIRKRSSLSTKSSSSPASIDLLPVESIAVAENGERSFYDDTGEERENEYYSMDEIWREIAASDQEGRNFFACESMASPIWSYCGHDSPWMMEEDESKMFGSAITDPFFAGFKLRARV